MASRALRRSAAAMLRQPRRRRMAMARLRRLAMARGAVPVRTWQASLGKGGVADVVQRLDAPVTPDPVCEAGGLAWAAVRLVTAYTVTVRQRRQAAGPGG
jgi:hypothetical protein